MEFLGDFPGKLVDVHGVPGEIYRIGAAQAGSKGVGCDCESCAFAVGNSMLGWRVRDLKFFPTNAEWSFQRLQVVNRTLHPEISYMHFYSCNNIVIVANPHSIFDSYGSKYDSRSVDCSQSLWSVYSPVCLLGIP